MRLSGRTDSGRTSTKLTSSQEARHHFRSGLPGHTDTVVVDLGLGPDLLTVKRLLSASCSTLIQHLGYLASRRRSNKERQRSRHGTNIHTSTESSGASWRLKRRLGTLACSTDLLIFGQCRSSHDPLCRDSDKGWRKRLSIRLSLAFVVHVVVHALHNQPVGFTYRQASEVSIKHKRLPEQHVAGGGCCLWGLGVGRLFLWGPSGLAWPMRPYAFPRNTWAVGTRRGQGTPVEPREGGRRLARWQRRIAEAHRLKDGPWPRHDTNRHQNRPASRNAVHD